MAVLIDGLIIGSVNFTISIIASIAAGLGSATVPDLADTTSTLMSLGVFSISIVLNLLYYVGFLAKKGATPGKMALGLVVVDTDLQPLTVTKAFLREAIGKFVSAIVFGLGYFWAIWDEKKQTWHDKIAGTLVVEKNSLSS